MANQAAVDLEVVNGNERAAKWGAKGGVEGGGRGEAWGGGKLVLKWASFSLNVCGLADGRLQVKVVSK